MDKKQYHLMHRDEVVCSVLIDPITGAILKASRPSSPELLPLGGSIDSAMLRKWWQRRAVPVSQGNIRRILERIGITTHAYLEQNLGLSLTDHYWIKPLDADFGWQEINLFTNDFRDAVGDMQLSGTIDEVPELPTNAFSPSSSAQGELRKKWIISDGKRFLIKGNHGGNSQESLNEVVASLIHKKQKKQPFVDYTPIQLSPNQPLCCICESFTSDEIEFIPAIDVVDSKKKDNNISLYEHFIQVCSMHGLDESVVRSFLEYQILTDFILTNTDRHLNNFGVLRDTHTLKFIGMAPIFDSGNSMFWQNPRLPERDDLTKIEVNSFRGKEIQLLEYVTDKSAVDLHQLPSCDELREIYEKDPLIPCLDSILLGYQKKIELL